MSFKCDICKEEDFSEDEVIGLSCNDGIVSLSEFDIENNGQNPDYWVKTICCSCYEENEQELDMMAILLNTADNFIKQKKLNKI